MVFTLSILPDRPATRSTRSRASAWAKLSPPPEKRSHSIAERSPIPATAPVLPRANLSPRSLNPPWGWVGFSHGGLALAWRGYAIALEETG
jgi:hypothetical protein